MRRKRRGYTFLRIWHMASRGISRRKLCPTSRSFLKSSCCRSRGRRLHLRRTICRRSLIRWGRLRREDGEARPGGGGGRQSRSSLELVEAFALGQLRPKKRENDHDDDSACPAGNDGQLGAEYGGGGLGGI